MKRYIITMASVLITLTTFAQSLLVVEREGSNDEFIYENSMEISFWGQPIGEEQNGDLTITPIEVKGNSMSFVMKATQWDLFTRGFYISETEGAWDVDMVTYIGGSTGHAADAELKNDLHCFVIDVDFDDNDECMVTVTGLKANTTYYIKPFVQMSESLTLGTVNEFVFGSEKSVTTLWTITDFLLAQEDWYTDINGITPVQGEFIVPSADAWNALCGKYKEFFGEEQSQSVKKSLITEWFRHLTPAEADMMKAHSVAYYDNCEDGDIYVVNRVCDEMIPNLLKASSDIDLRNPNCEENNGKPLYTKNCEPMMVGCSLSYGIAEYIKTEPTTQSANPNIAFDFPFTLLPNRIYNVSVTIAPNTEDPEDIRPNKFRLSIFNEGNVAGTKIENPQKTTQDNIDYDFIYGGSKLETFTFQVDTHKEEYATSKILQFNSYVTSKQTSEYSRTLRIAKIIVSPEMEDVVPGDADMDGFINQDDVQTVASAVILGEEDASDEKPATDFTGDGKTLIDDAVALVNYIQTGEFKPASSKARARYAAAIAPKFTTQKTLNITAGENTTMSVDVSGIANYTAASFDIKVPQGVRIAIDKSGKPKVAFGDAATTKHNLKAAMQEDGKTIRIACYADDNACFTKDNGSIITVALTADFETEPAENAQISLANCMMTKPNVTSVILDDYLINVGIANGVDQVEETDTTIDGYYTIDGIPLSTPRRGLNIVKMKDGSVKKMWVK